MVTGEASRSQPSDVFGFDDGQGNRFFIDPKTVRPRQQAAPNATPLLCSAPTPCCEPRPRALTSTPPPSPVRLRRGSPPGTARPGLGGSRSTCVHPPTRPPSPSTGLPLRRRLTSHPPPPPAQSEEHNRPYYYNNVTHEVVWERPADSNVAWIMYHEELR